MLHKNSLRLFKTLSLGVDNESISGQILCSFGGNMVMKKTLIPFIRNYLLKRLLGSF